MLWFACLIVGAIVYSKNPHITSMQNPEIQNENWILAGFPCSDPVESLGRADCLEILRIYSSFWS